MGMNEMGILIVTIAAAHCLDGAYFCSACEVTEAKVTRDFFYNLE